MMTKHAPTAIYKQRIEAIAGQLKKLKKKRNLVGWSRFACIIAAIAIFYYLLPSGIFTALSAAAFFIAIFFRLVIIAVNNNEKIRNLQSLAKINEDEIQIALGQFHEREGGAELLPALHDYAYDLDIFGRASLYQYINRTTSEQGHKRLAQWLLMPAEKNTILQRQEAVKELSTNYEWRQQLQAHGMAENISGATQQKLNAWVLQDNAFIHKAHWKWLRFLLPGIICLALVLAIVGTLPSPLFWGMVFIFFIISGTISKRIMPEYLQLDKIVTQINTLSKSLDWIEKESFDTPLMQQLRQEYVSGDSKASQEVKGLKAILDRMDLRLNPVVFIPLNIFFFWDLQQALALEKWKSANKAAIARWFEALAEIEALSTLANLYFNHPQWEFPALDDNDGTFIANELGHPLIPESKRVSSSFATSGKPRMALITGSNMAGKSTFLRSVGINIVLAMMGAPVCAAGCKVAVMRVISTMRITDNLEESTSTFYAELKKLKYIITAVNNQEKVFLLLDEILRGTNSLDRHTGSQALINQLVRHKAAGMLATHDLELAKLAEEHPQAIHNYHFDVQVEGDELYFDYKLKDGICKSLNASILMKKIGIEL